MFKFLHAADIHLDSPLRGLERYEGAPVDRIRQATRRALENLVDLALDEGVEFVLLAGDLYDGDWRDYSTGLFFAAEMSRLREADIDVFLIRGNHDAANRMTRSLSFPDNVHALPTKEPESVHLDRLGVAIHGQGFASAAVSENLARRYPAAVPDCVNIGLLHTSATGYEGHEPYAPCGLADLIDKGYEYWALGHVHKRQILHQEPWIVYAGNIQGRHIREAGAKGSTLVTVDGGKVTNLEPRELDVLRWAVCSLDVTSCGSGYDVRDLFAERLAERLAEANGRALALRVELRGASRAHRHLAAEPERWRNELRSVAADVGHGEIWVEKIVHDTSLSTPVQDPLSSSRGDPIGELLELVRELDQDPGALAELGAELDDLKRKLPSELREGKGALDLESPGRLRKVLEHVGQKLVAELLPGESR